MSVKLSELAGSYFSKGKACISDGKILLENPNSFGSHGILLTQGIELLLSAFLLLQDPSIFKEEDLYLRYRHKLRAIYDQCKKVDKKGVLVGFLPKFLGTKYYKSSVEARYPKVFRVMEVRSDIYTAIETDLIPRIELLLELHSDPNRVDPLDYPGIETWAFQDEPIFEDEPPEPEEE